MNSDWLPTPSKFALSPGAIHVWLADLDQWAANSQTFTEVCNHNEHLREARIRRDLDRKRYISARSVLRILLGRYLKHAPGSLSFRHNRYGKPSLAVSENASELARSLRFNLAHSHELAVFVIAWDREVGIDIEYMGELPEWESVAETIFTPRELRAFVALPKRERLQALYEGWTRKEALLKGVGYGLVVPPDQVDVLATSTEPAIYLTPLAPCIENKYAARWSIRDLPHIPGYAASVAVEGYVRRVIHWRCEQSQLIL